MKLTRMVAATITAVTVAVGGFAAPAFAGGNFQTTTDVNLRVCQWLNNSQCTVKYTLPKGTTVYLNCWATGSSVNGVSVWYNAFYGSDSGMLTGAYVNTGHDPNPAVGQCF